MYLFIYYNVTLEAAVWIPRAPLLFGIKSGTPFLNRIWGLGNHDDDNNVEVKEEKKKQANCDDLQNCEENLPWQSQDAR